jgi:large subunit ribosomal protein L22
MSTKQREKAKVRREVRKNGPVLASLYGLRMSARKVRVIADLVRGERVGEALIELAFQRRAAARPLSRLLDSAVANASEKGLDVDKLIIDKVLVHKGAIGRRFMPRAQGRASPIRKQTAHIDIRLVKAV